MALQQIRWGLMASCLIVVSILANLLVMQPGDGRAPRPDRVYRGLSGLPGTPSTTVSTATSAAAAQGSVTATQQARDDDEVILRTMAQTGSSSGQTSGLVQTVQMELAKRGYVTGNSTGTLDIVTRAAIMAFEHDRGLSLRAEPTMELVAELRSDVPLAVGGNGGSHRAGPEAEAVIRVVQQSLARLNYRPGVADGVMGQATAAAICTFERDQQLPESGRVSGILLTRLAQLAGTGRLAQH